MFFADKPTNNSSKKAELHILGIVKGMKVFWRNGSLRVPMLFSKTDSVSTIQMPESLGYTNFQFKIRDQCSFVLRRMGDDRIYEIRSLFVGVPLLQIGTSSHSFSHRPCGIKQLANTLRQSGIEELAGR